MLLLLINGRLASHTQISQQILCKFFTFLNREERQPSAFFMQGIYEGWNFNSGNYLFTTDTK